MTEEERTRTKHIFFDAEGTLYVPKRGRTYMDFWNGDRTPERARRIFELDRDTKQLLAELRRKGHSLSVVSRHEEHILMDLLEYFGIRDYFDEVMVNGDKGERIRDFVDTAGISLGDCVMVGDTPELDILPVLKQGIECLLVSREHNQDFVFRRIDSLHEVLKRVGN